eukprot:2221063-Alexandrium_andersonii.AAC.1
MGIKEGIIVVQGLWRVAKAQSLLYPPFALVQPPECYVGHAFSHPLVMPSLITHFFNAHIQEPGASQSEF